MPRSRWLWVVVVQVFVLQAVLAGEQPEDVLALQPHGTQHRLLYTLTQLLPLQLPADVQHVQLQLAHGRVSAVDDWRTAAMGAGLSLRLQLHPRPGCCNASSLLAVLPLLQQLSQAPLHPLPAGPECLAASLHALDAAGCQWQLQLPEVLPSPTQLGSLLRQLAPCGSAAGWPRWLSALPLYAGPRLVATLQLAPARTQVQAQLSILALVDLDPDQSSGDGQVSLNWLPCEKLSSHLQLPQSCVATMNGSASAAADAGHNEPTTDRLWQMPASRSKLSFRCSPVDITARTPRVRLAQTVASDTLDAAIMITRIENLRTDRAIQVTLKEILAPQLDYKFHRRQYFLGPQRPADLHQYRLPQNDSHVPLITGDSQGQSGGAGGSLPERRVLRQLLHLPAASTLEIRTPVAKKWLHADDFGLAPFRGVWVPAVEIQAQCANIYDTAACPAADTLVSLQAATATRLQLSVPDMSMPYNVLMITGFIYFMAVQGFLALGLGQLRKVS